MSLTSYLSLTALYSSLTNSPTPPAYSSPMNLHLSLTVLYSSLTNSPTPPAYSSLINLHLSLTVLYSSLTNSPTPPAYSSPMNLLSSLRHPLSSLTTLPSLTVPYLSLTAPYLSLTNFLASTPGQTTACCSIRPLTNPWFNLPSRYILMVSHTSFVTIPTHGLWTPLSR